MVIIKNKTQLILKKNKKNMVGWKIYNTVISQRYIFNAKKHEQIPVKLKEYMLHTIPYNILINHANWMETKTLHLYPSGRSPSVHEHTINIYR